VTDPLLVRIMLGLLIASIGALLRIAALHHLREADLTDDQFFHGLPPDRYTAQGPYAWMDHPAYVGSLLIFGGGGILFLGWGGFIIILAAWPFYEDRIRWENRVRRTARERGVDGA